MRSDKYQLLNFFIGSLLLFVSCQQNANEATVNTMEWTNEDRTYLVQQLERTRNEVLEEISELNESQWNFRESDERWSIAEIIEHQEVHDELYYRELTVLTQLPEMSKCWQLDRDADSLILEYSFVTNANKGKSPWYLEPQGRWPNKSSTIDAFKRVRNNIIKFVRTTDKDLRFYYTPSGRGQADMRDLHQLMLISIAHTDRHLSQIRRVKSHTNFPIN